MTSSSDPENTPDDSISVHSSIPGVPAFTVQSYQTKQSKYCILIPIINEGERIHHELERATNAKIPSFGDIIICDGGSTDGSTEEHLLRQYGVNTLLVKTGPGKQGAQLRMGLWWALQRGYDGSLPLTEMTRTASKTYLNSYPSFRKVSTSFRARVLGGGGRLSTRLSSAMSP